jgi:hypothetical protein
LANKYIDQHPTNLPGIMSSFKRALGNAPIQQRDTKLFELLERGELTALSTEDRAYLQQLINGTMDDAHTTAALRAELHRYSRMLLLTLALEVDRLEQLIRKHHPEYHYIDLEVL